MRAYVGQVGRYRYAQVNDINDEEGEEHSSPSETQCQGECN